MSSAKTGSTEAPGENGPRVDPSSTPPKVWESKGSALSEAPLKTPYRARTTGICTSAGRQPARGEEPASE